MNESAFYTRTMATVYTDQGHFDRAAQIYRHLLQKEPDRQDLRAALSDVEHKLAEKNKKQLADLTPLFEEWIDLLLRYNHLQKLTRLKRRLQEAASINDPDAREPSQ